MKNIIKFQARNKYFVKVNIEMHGPIGENLGKVMSKLLFTELAKMH